MQTTKLYVDRYMDICEIYCFDNEITLYHGGLNEFIKRDSG